MAVLKFNVAPAHNGPLLVGAGVAGVAGCALITTLTDAGELHPAALVTVKV